MTRGQSGGTLSQAWEHPGPPEAERQEVASPRLRQEHVLPLTLAPGTAGEQASVFEAPGLRSLVAALLWFLKNHQHWTEPRVLMAGGRPILSSLRKLESLGGHVTQAVSDGIGFEPVCTTAPG